MMNFPMQGHRRVRTSTPRIDNSQDSISALPFPGLPQVFPTGSSRLHQIYSPGLLSPFLNQTRHCFFPAPPGSYFIMAGGVKKPVNIFRLKDLPEPKEVFNWRLWFAVLSFGLMGAARGVDEGLVTGAFNSKDFQRYIDYESYGEVEQTNIKANVSAMVQIGSVGGALLYVSSFLVRVPVEGR